MELSATTQTELLTGLNSPQRDAVLHSSGPMLVIAGAGSGKTRVITHRIAHLIARHGYAPEAILAVTFTNKAAKEMLQRVAALTGKSARGAWICTFHAMCVRILRQDIERLGYDANFTIYDDADQNALIKECTASFGKKAEEPGYYRAAIGRAKNRLITADEMAARGGSASDKQIAHVYRLYQRKLREQNALDFDDLLLLTIRLFQEHPDVLAVYQDRFQQIMVDEYQDTNHLQYALIERLAAKHRNLCIVGDDFQSVYSFRLADISNILNFQEDYPDARVVKLEQNYRSTQTILDAANAVIAKNTQQLEKRMWTENGVGEPIRICRCPTDRHEAIWTIEQILYLQKRYRLADMAVLYRTNAQSRVIEEECLKYHVPYRLVGGLKFYDRKEVKDILAYLRLIHNPQDSLSLQRIVNVPARGVGAKTLQKYAQVANETECSLFEAMRKESGGTSKADLAVARFTDTIWRYHEQQEELSIGRLMAVVLDEFGYRTLYNPSKEKDRDRLENIDEFLRVGAEFDRRRNRGTLKSFLDHIALLTDLDKTDDEADMITLMTVHASKGLEYPVVFLVGMEENLFPHRRSIESPSALEEERRLCYVGMTRAKELLYLTHAESRTQFGQPVNCLPSMFLDEIPPEFIEECAY